jgi:hypothetical protein
MMAQEWRRQPSSYCYGPIVEGWTTHASIRRRAWWCRALRWWFPSPAGCREELQNPPDLGLTTAAATKLFVDGGSGVEGFPDTENIRAKEVGPQGAHTTWRRGRGAAPPYGVDAPWPSSGPPLVLWCVTERYWLWALFHPIPRIFPE